jgi:hypothetical protein
MIWLMDARPDLAERDTMRRTRKGLAIVLIVTAVALALVVVETQTNTLRRLYDNHILDNRGHYLPCERLPTEAEVRQVLQQHAATVQAIEQVNPGLVGVEIEPSTCPGRADIVIWYASHANRLAIEAIIGGDTFFGVPYRLQNR